MAAIEDPLSDEAIIASSFQNSSQTGDAGINTITSSFQNSRQTETAGDDSLLKTRGSIVAIVMSMCLDLHINDTGERVYKNN